MRRWNASYEGALAGLPQTLAPLTPSLTRSACPLLLFQRAFLTGRDQVLHYPERDPGRHVDFTRRLPAVRCGKEPKADGFVVPRRAALQPFQLIPLKLTRVWHWWQLVIDLAAPQNGHHLLQHVVVIYDVPLQRPSIVVECDQEIFNDDYGVAGSADSLRSEKAGVDDCWW